MKTAITALLLFAIATLKAQDFKASIDYNDNTLTIHLKNISKEELVILSMAGVEPNHDSLLTTYWETKESPKDFPLHFSLGNNSTKFKDRDINASFQPGEEDTWTYDITPYIRNYKLKSGELAIVYTHANRNTEKKDKANHSFVYRFSIPK